MGLFDLFGSGGSGQSRQSTNQSSNWNQTSSQVANPWAGIQPFLTGGDGVKGIFPEAGRLYDSTGWTPALQDTAARWFNDLANRRNIFDGNGFANAGAAMVAGQFDPAIAAAGPIAGAPPIEAPQRTLGDVRAGQGDLDPTEALQGFLSGDSTNPWVERQQQAITDTLTRNLRENVLPGIRHSAIADGQYGGSRGDMAEGLALSRLDADIAPALTQLAGNAYEAEQGRKYGVADALNRQAFDFAQAEASRKLQRDTINAGNLLDVQKFNTGTSLANNAQAMQAAAQAVANRGAGLDFAGAAAGLQDRTYADMLQALDLPQDFDWDQLARYARLIQPSAGLFPAITTNSAGTANSSGTTTGSRRSGSSGFSGEWGPILDTLLGQIL